MGTFINIPRHKARLVRDLKKQVPGQDMLRWRGSSPTNINYTV
jgi:hypothetical protein